MPTSSDTAAPAESHPALTGDDVRFLLCTDLDGTFLAGTSADRLRLYQMLGRRSDTVLVYVTGRGLEAVLPLLSDPTLPQPDYIICDVGATVVHGEDCGPVEPLQAEISQRWPGDQAVFRAIGDWQGLTLQDVPQSRRCSFYCDENAITDGLCEAVADLGCDLLYSSERYLDILPKDVNKGSTLDALLKQLDVPHERVLVAGDTLNDRAMFERGMAGVCVGGSEAGLLDVTREMENVLHAERSGCGGILEAIAHFKLLPAAALEEERGSSREPGKSDLVMVYHRLPYEEVMENGTLKRRRPTSPNGIIPTLLSFFARGQPGAWVAWSIQHAEQDEFEPHTPVDAKKYPNLIASRVALSKKEVDTFYKKFSKEAFWPLLHTFWERARFREDHWQVFCEVNRKFAEHAAAEASHEGTVWIHDYNLWMVPAYLRELRPDVRIAFFHHTHFPSADVFNVVPWRRAIIGSLLQCDYVGFHIPRQVENFVDVVRGVAPVKVLESENCAPRFITYGCAVGLDTMSTCIDVGGRQLHLGAHPVGLDVKRISSIVHSEATSRRIAKLSEELEGRKLLLSVERLDYTKGTLQKLHAFERVLDRNPDLHGDVVLCVICVPAAKEMTIYRQLQQHIEQAVGRINGRFSRMGWTPVQFFFRPLPFEELQAYYAVADVMWITPLRDGLNLVAKEYITVQGTLDRQGVLVLSEFAGAAAELKSALLTNPHDIEDLVDVCQHALRLEQGEARRRMRELYDIVRHHDVARWGEEFLQAVHSFEPDHSATGDTV